MNISNSSFCATVELDSAFLILSILILTVTVISFLLNSFTFHLLTRCHSFHSNVRLLLKNFTLSASFFSLALFGRNVYNFYVWRHGLFGMSGFACEVSEVAWDISAGSATHSISFIGVERLITTIWKHDYADTGRPSKLATTMAAACWGSGVGISSFMILTALFDANPICFCTAAGALPLYAQFIVCPVYTLLEASTVACFMFLYCHSRSAYLDFTVNTHQHSLAQRHQLMTNMETTLLLAPVMVVHGATYIVVLASFTFIRACVDDLSLASDLSVATVLLMAVETVIHPVFLLTKHKKLQQVAVDCFPSLRHVLTVREDDSVIPSGHLRQPANKKGPVALMRARASGKNIIAPSVVEFRVKPEDNDQILNNLWEKKPRSPR